MPSNSSRKRRSFAHPKQPEFNNPELVFGIVGPIGVRLDEVIGALQKELSLVGYKSVVIHITDHMETTQIAKQVDRSSSYYNKYMSLIAYANQYRKQAKNAAALAGLALIQIQKERRAITQDIRTPSPGTAYIVRQFKRLEEVTLMRKVYGRKFVQVSVFGSEEARRSVIIEKIKGYDPSPKSEADCEIQAIELIQKDYKEAEEPSGQLISEVFHLGDVFIDGINIDVAELTIHRFIRAFFGDNKSSPNKDEYGLYMAAAAALRSCDLSRQVGAAIFSEKGEIISLGCNEVPKARGGTYWCDGGAETFRDVDIGQDANHERRSEIIFDFLSRLKREGFISGDYKTTKDLFDKIMSRKRITESQLMDIIEFGRMIHAEMSAIADAARTGRSVRDAILYCTTFPCHICAKHIVASGIERVVFLEPYPKSYARKLHSDSISLETAADGRVLFQPFMGISPRRYRDIFEKKRRKDKDGRALEWYEEKPLPQIEDRSNIYIDNEDSAAVAVLGKMVSAT